MNSKIVAQNFVSFVVGFIFAVGLAVAGMTEPQKVIGFLSLPNWDPSLIFVMAGAIGVHALTYPLIRKKASPLLDSTWHIPNRNDITSRLVIGSLLFGVGWGLGGFCPGPGVASVLTFDLRVLIFVGAMLGGMLLFKLTEPYLRMRK